MTVSGSESAFRGCRGSLITMCGAKVIRAGTACKSSFTAAAHPCSQAGGTRCRTVFIGGTQFTILDPLFLPTSAQVRAGRGR